MIRKIHFAASLLITGLASVLSPSAVAQVVAPSTFANITIDPQPRDPNGVPIGSPSSAAFDEWDSIPLAVADPEDNPSVLNIIDIADIKVANDENLLYIYASGHKLRTNGLYLAFDTDQNVATGFDIFGLGLVGSELGYVNDFVFDQRTPGVFNDNKTNGNPDPGGACCTGGPLDVDNGGALLYPGWDVEFVEREWAVPLDAVWSVNEPLGPTFPNPTFNFILWTDQGLTDVTDVITYTLAEAPDGQPGDYNDDGNVDAADYVVWRKNEGTSNVLPNDPDGGMIDVDQYNTWRNNFGDSGGGARAGSAVPEPTSAGLLIVAALTLAILRRRF